MASGFGLLNERCTLRGSSLCFVVCVLMGIFGRACGIAATSCRQLLSAKYKKFIYIFTHTYKYPHTSTHPLICVCVCVCWRRATGCTHYLLKAYKFHYAKP